MRSNSLTALDEIKTLRGCESNFSLIPCIDGGREAADQSIRAENSVFNGPSDERDKTSTLEGTLVPLIGS